ncbi:hypothetical protein FJT64_002463 [Amphibalanus amphitrite]|uniref:Apple domain-containing protein n=1 Tax=Amphibalanus amphitrite TaxID=1232801 RepID=A0A6A4WJZ7_AMPAM|nr:hypothetical protein FJT64_002463 [Amphibalanus amphitrite]
MTGIRGGDIGLGRHPTMAQTDAAPLMTPLMTLMTLVTSAAAALYGWQQAVTLSGAHVEATTAPSKITCGIKCEAQDLHDCTGFSYEPDDGTCRLLSGGCRGPAVDGQQGIYLSALRLPDAFNVSCACPAGFSRCAGRCLMRLDRVFVYTDAESQCAALGAHLAVPRSDEENQCAMNASLDWPV